MERPLAKAVSATASYKLTKKKPDPEYLKDRVDVLPALLYSLFYVGKTMLNKILIRVGSGGEL